MQRQPSGDAVHAGDRQRRHVAFVVQRGTGPSRGPDACGGERPDHRHADSGEPATTYTVTVTDANTTTDSATFSLTVNGAWWRRRQFLRRC